MKTIALIVTSILISAASFAQTSKTDSLTKVNIKKLDFMVGNWNGNGWILGRNGKSEFRQTERIQFKLDSTAIIIEGKGVSNGKVIHDALAILTYDKQKDNYSFRSYLPSGQNAEFEGELIDNKFHWYPNENVRYIIWLDDNNNWYETGEYKKGDAWSQFFEMTLASED
ncbi:MAG: hypothetical protein GYB35_06555 [Algicola sp.]|nr:hypothetical protein [Algicola sp.]